MEQQPFLDSPIYLMHKPTFHTLRKTSELFSTLFLKEKICLRCIFRIYSFNSLILYRDASFYLELVAKMLGEEVLKEYCVTQYGMSPICWLCQGILQRDYISKILKIIVEKLAKRGNMGLKKYKLNIRVSSITIMKYQILLHKVYDELSIQFPQKKDMWNKILIQQLNKQNSIQIKTILKWLFSEYLNSNQQFGLQSTINQDEFTVIINIQQNYINLTNQNQLMGLFLNQSFAGKTNNPHKKIKLDHKDLKCTQNNINKVGKMPHQNIIKVLKNHKDYEQILKGQIPQKIDNSNFNTDITLQTQNIYLSGKYIKYSRYLSQTPWIIDGKRLTESSLQEEIQNQIYQYFYPQKNKEDIQIKFHSGGRQDIDVRMLHGGRPFVIQFVNPLIRLSQISISQLQQKLSLEHQKQLKILTQNMPNKYKIIKYLQTIINCSNKLVQVRQLAVAKESFISNELKAAQTQKIKHYVCYIQTKQPITQDDKLRMQSIKNLKINQKTPIRVLHRRSLMIRQKQVYRIIFHQVSQCSGVLELWASAGTYIKQFVHGDLNRTRPNIGEILNGKEVDILQLDVGGLKEGLWDWNSSQTMKLSKLEWEAE